MVIQAPTVLTSGGSGADGLSYTTAVINPDPGSVIAVFVENGALASGENDVPLISDTIGLTWTQEDTETGYSTLWMRGTWFTAYAPNNDAGTITFTYAHTQSSCHWHVLQILGARDVDPVVQAMSTPFNTTTNPSINLPAAPDPTSLVLGAAMRNGTTPYAAGPNHTIISSVAGSSNPAVGSDVSYDMAPASQAVGFTTASGAQKTIFALEIAMGGEVAPPPTPAEATMVRKWKFIDTAATNTIVTNAPHDIEVGETLVISLTRVTGATVGAITGVTGIGANVATVVAESIRASTLVVDFIVIPVTEQILSGATITINIASGSPSRKAVVCSVWAGLTGEVNAGTGMTGPNGSTAAVSASTTSGVSVTKALMLSAVGHGNVGFTPDPAYTFVDGINTAVGSSDRGVSLQSKVETTTGVKTAGGTIASGTWAAALIALTVESAAAGAPVADAGGDVIDVEPGDPIDFSADGSTAAGAMTFVWTQTGGEPVNFTVTGPDLHINEAPWTIAGTTLTFQVSVTSGGLTTTDDVSAIILPSEGRIKVNGVEVPLKTTQHG